VPQDDVQAAQWCRKAAEQGHAAAQRFLGDFYSTGLGVPQDDVEAHKWMNLAAARTSGADQKRFADARDEIAAKMTPAQVAEAQKRAREWTEAFERRQK
jgi:TPR repeat protein